MWPSRKGVGVQLGYGIESPSLHLEQVDSDKPWQFARERDAGYKFNKVHNSTQRLVKAQISNFDLETSHDQNLFDNIVIKDVSRYLIEEIFKNDKYMNNQFIYDPASVGTILDYGVIRKRNSRKEIPVFAYVSSSSKTVLSVQTVLHESSMVWRTNKDKDIQKEDFKKDLSKQVASSRTNEGDDIRFCEEVQVPCFGTGACIEFNYVIRQVQILKSSASLPLRQTSILVRTSSSVFIVKLDISTAVSDDINIIQEAEISPSDLSNVEFSDATNNPYDNTQFAVIDKRGNWGIYKPTGSKEKATLLYKGLINDPEDLSNYKKLSWTDNPSEILIMSRRYLKRLNITTGTTTDLIIANHWSELRDYQICDSDNRLGFLLTSQELIMVDVSKDFKRLISWKHYLSNEDASLRFNMTTINDTLSVLIQSQVYPSVFVYQFKLDDLGFPKSLNDPYMINLNSSPGQSYALVPLHANFIALFKISTQLEITRTLFSLSKEWEIRKNDTLNRFSISSDTKTAVFEEPEKSLLPNLHKLTNQQLRSLKKKLFHISKSDSEIDDFEVFQNYTNSLDLEEIKEKQPLSLQNISIAIEEFNDFEELDNMIEQLAEYISDNHLEIVSFGDISNLVDFNEKKLSNFKELYDKLLTTWKSSIMAKSATRDMFSSMSLIFDRKLLQRKNISSKLPPKLKAILEDWDKDYETEDEDQNIDPIIESFASQQPVIKITQSQPSTQQRNHTESTVSSSQRTLLKPTSQSIKMSQKSAMRPERSSQIVPSQSQKKKKRRVKGFA